MEEINLKVGDLTANRQDYGRGIARLSSNYMKQIGVREGDYIEVRGKKKSYFVAVRAYPSDVGLDVVRIDGLSRRNCGAGIGETVKVKKAELKEGKKVTIAPAEKGMMININPEYVKQNLLMRPVSKGDILIPNPVVRRRNTDFFDDFFGGIFGDKDVFFAPFGNVKFVVADVDPKEGGFIDEATEVEVLSKAVEVKEEERIPEVTYEDIGGLEREIDAVREIIELPLRSPELFQRLGVKPPKGVLMHGPPGTGKTLLAKAVANESGANFYSIAGPEIMSKWYGQSEENLRKKFEEAEKNAPSIIFIDEIDAIAPKREEVSGEVERRVVSQLLNAMDGLKTRGQVIVIAATNRPDSIDPALRRGGRFDREIEIGVPNQKGRLEVLQIHTRNMPLSEDVNMEELAQRTYGFVGADLEMLAKEAAMHALRRVIPDLSELKGKEISKEILEKLRVTKEDFDYAMQKVEPSAMREVLVEVPNITWNDIGGLENVKEKLREVVEWPLKYPDKFEALHIKPPSGILLYGPPGTGKTLLAKAVANESGANFILVRGPELLTKWVGESIPEDEYVVARVNKILRMIKIGELYELWREGTEIEVPSMIGEKIEYSKIQRISKHKRSSPIAEITTESGRKVKATLDHSLFSVVDGKIDSVPTSKLHMGDWVVLPQYLPDTNLRNIEGVKITHEKAKLLGLYLAEGDINRNRVRLHISETELAEKAMDICNKVGYNAIHYKKDHSLHIISEEFLNLCSLMGKRAKNKKLGIFLSLSKDLLSNLLKGYFSGDGSFYLKDHQRSAFIESITVSKLLGIELLFALNRYGIIANKKERVNRVGNLEHKILIGRTEYIKRFFEEIGFLQEDKTNRIESFMNSRKWTRGEKNIPRDLLVDSVDGYYVNAVSEYISDRAALKLLKKVPYTSLYFDKIKEIKILDRNDEHVYDIVEVNEGHNFVGGEGFLLHNSERKLREIFRRAKQAAPSIIFFDEIDAMTHTRGTSRTEVVDTLVSQLLTELSGVEELEGVIVIAATNRPDMIDPSLLRPGRFDRHILVPTPDEATRLSILNVHTRNMPLAEDVDLKELARRTKYFSGADLESLAREAAMNALRETIRTGKAKKIEKKDFETVLKRIAPSIPQKLTEWYDKFDQIIHTPEEERQQEVEEPEYTR